MKTKSIILGILMVVLVACDDYLEKFPLDAPSSSSFPKTKDELIIAVNGAYNALHYQPSSFMQAEIYFEAATDLAFSRGGFAISDDIVLGISTPNTGVYSNSWNNYYRGIQRCNFILDNMAAARQTIDAAICDRVEAEAKFLRAWNYMYLTELFGDVPFVTNMLKLEDSELPKSSKAEIVNTLLSDLDFCASKLPVTHPAADNGRITKGASLSLKAIIALYNKKYDVAATAAKAVMDLGVYSLESNYGNLFQIAGNNSKESIFQLNYHLDVTKNFNQVILNSRAGQGWSVLVPSQWLVDSYLCTDGKPINESPLYNQAKPFENRDPRLRMSLIVPGDWFGGIKFETHPDSVQTFRMTGSTYTRIGNQEVTNPFATFSGYLWRKNCDETQFTAPYNGGTMPFKLIRYAEILLVYAEAKMELNQIDQSAIDAFNLVRRRVQMPDLIAGITQTEFRRLLRLERKVELAGEGKRLFDIRRWRIADKVLNGNMAGRKNKAYWYNPGLPSFNEAGHPVYTNQSEVFKTIQARKFDVSKDWLWAIPQKDIDINKNLTQNTGYN